MNLAPLVKKLTDGDHLTDDELQALKDGYTKVVDAVVYFGERYDVVLRDAVLRLEQVSAYLHVRRVKAGLE